MCLYKEYTENVGLGFGRSTITVVILGSSSDVSLSSSRIVDISADGLFLAVGVPYLVEETNDYGRRKPVESIVRVFQWVEDRWSQMGGGISCQGMRLALSSNSPVNLTLATTVRSSVRNASQTTHVNLYHWTIGESKEWEHDVEKMNQPGDALGLSANGRALGIGSNIIYQGHDDGEPSPATAPGGRLRILSEYGYTIPRLPEQPSCIHHLLRFLLLHSFCGSCCIRGNMHNNNSVRFYHSATHNSNGGVCCLLDWITQPPVLKHQSSLHPNR